MSDINAITYTRMVDVTPSDSTAQFTEPCAGFMVDVAGTVHLRLVGATTTHTITCSAGTIYTMAVVQFYAGGTSATGIHAVCDPLVYRGWS